MVVKQQDGDKKNTQINLFSIFFQSIFFQDGDKRKHSNQSFFNVGQR
jgi:hypothetical protein